MFSQIGGTAASSTFDPPPMDYVEYAVAEYPSSTPPEFSRIMTIVMGDNQQCPFENDEEKLFNWFANHPNKTQIMGTDYTGNLAILGPNHLLELQTSSVIPRRWLLLKISLPDSPDWIGLVVRGDTLYVKGLFNQHGKYQIPECKMKGEPRYKVTYLPEEYVVLKDDWELNYATFLKCTQAELLKKLQVVLEKDDLL